MVDTPVDEDVLGALEALDSARRRFVAVVGHELRTPVTTLRGFAEELAAAESDAAQDLVPAIVRNARRVEQLLDDLLLATEIITALPVGDAGADRPGLHGACHLGRSRARRGAGPLR